MVRSKSRLRDSGKYFQKQTQSDIPIELIMDEGLYEDCSRAMAEKIDDHSKENIEALVALAVMELQFFRGSDVDWKKEDVEAPEQALSPGGKESDGEMETASEKESDDGSPGEKDTFDFTRIDSTDVLSDETLKGLRYSDPDKFMKQRECFALAMLMFLSEDLSCKLSELSGEVHAGWRKKFGKPIDFEQILHIPDEIKTAFNYSNEEQDWLEGTLQHFVSDMSLEQLEAAGITDEHLEELKIPTPRKAKKQAAATGKVHVKPPPIP